MPRLAQIFTLLVIFLFLNILVYGDTNTFRDSETRTPTVLHTPIPEKFIQSKIYFNSDFFPLIQTASIATTDPLNHCPMDALPQDMLLAVNQLVTKIRESVAKMKATQGPECNILQNRMTATQQQLATALQNQFVPGTLVSASTNQQQINTGTRQASAINQLILTTADLVNQQCIESTDTRIVIQKIIGQIITLGGLFAGGWQGISAAAGGQIIANLPLFHGEFEATLKLFQDYDLKTERGSFLCLYRQMQKTSCLLFSNKNDAVIGGLDLSFRSGAVQTTIQSVEKIKNQNPDLLSDVQLLREIYTSTDSLVSLFEKQEVFEKGSIPILQNLRSWCLKDAIQSLKTPFLHSNSTYQHPESIEQALQGLVYKCRDLNQFNWPIHHYKELAPFLDQFYWALDHLRDYYTRLKMDDKSVLSEIVCTWESMKFFENLKKSLGEYQNSDMGNQARIQYRNLTVELGKKLTQESFKKLIQESHKALTKHSFFSNQGIHLYRTRQRGLTATLDLCQTLDPTLACLYTDNPETDPVYRKWKRYCVGPRSAACKYAFKKGEPDLLAGLPHYRAYLNSLCGIISPSHSPQPATIH